ncbi:Agglutination protein [Mucinivorans hirudinis]|uniref:Agglutination protein n=1 Tax=Mucinivorans hirudinis TaxID=1433126 RepID=A0A060REA0_9BACT|nr:Agglutination protein [Mucinivorans hirudinis]
MKNKLIILLSIIVLPLASQQRFAVEQLVERLVENNYSNKIYARRTVQAENNVNISPMMPSLSATARQSSNGLSETNTIGLGATLNWRLFDGLAMFSTYDKTRAQLEVANLNQLANLESLVQQVINHYYLIVSLNSRAKVARELIALSQRRYEEALLRLDIESFSRLDVTLAKSDLNSDSTYLIRQLESLNLAYISLNQLLNFEYRMNGYVNDTIIVDKTFGKNELEELILAQNTQILLSKKGIDIADLNLRLNQAAQYPTLDFSAGYNYNAVNTRPATNYSTSNGANFGFTVGMNLFNGLTTRRNIANSKIDKDISNISLLNTENSVLTSFNSIYTSYQNNVRLIDFESENAEAMKFNLETAFLKYTQGSMSGIDLRNIQQQYLNAEDRKINALYLAKVSEISLRALAGVILRY